MLCRTWSQRSTMVGVGRSPPDTLRCAFAIVPIVKPCIDGKPLSRLVRGSPSKRATASASAGGTLERGESAAATPSLVTSASLLIGQGYTAHYPCQEFAGHPRVWCKKSVSDWRQGRDRLCRSHRSGEGVPATR